jgi:DNA polymerase-1
MRLLIDGDMLVHRSCVAVEKDTRFLDRYHILFSDFEDAWGVLQGTLDELTDIAGTDDVEMCFSDPLSNWRKEVDPTYKAHRVSSRKPLAYWAVVEELERRYPFHRIVTLEGDDVLGIAQTEATAREGGHATIIWSLDKDLKQIPGLHLRDDEVITITEEEADRFHLYQTLAGDVTDGYPGCPGVGTERAKKIVASGMKLWPVEKVLTRGPRKGEVETVWEEVPSETQWKTVLSHYRKAGLAPAEALRQARLARILRNTDYDNGVKLWVPSSH